MTFAGMLRYAHRGGENGSNDPRRSRRGALAEGKLIGGPGRTSLPSILAIAAMLWTLGSSTTFGQRYAVGDLVENFTLTDRATNQPVNLYDMEGKIVFLEWFAYWCPFCQAAAADIGPGIVDYYKDLGGNPSQLEVMHVALNLQSGAEAQTQNFVDFYRLGLTLNDFDRAVASRFQSSGQPIFAIINGVAGSSSHQQWELLYTELGYGSLNAPIAAFRSVIDSGGAPGGEAPAMSVQPAAQTIETGRRLNLSVVAVSELALSYQWKFNDDNIPGATGATLEIENFQASNAGQYSVAVSNANGSTTSEVADIEAVLGFLDSLVAQDVPEGQRGLLDDPDRDGIVNAYEFLARSDANDPASGEPPTIEIEVIEGVPYLVFTYVIDPSIRSLMSQPQFSISPAFDTDFLTPVLHAEIASESLTRFSFRTSTSLEAAPQFARLQMSAQP